MYNREFPALRSHNGNINICQSKHTIGQKKKLFSNESKIFALAGIIALTCLNLADFCHKLEIKNIKKLGDYFFFCTRICVFSYLKK